MPEMAVARTVAALRERVAGWRAQGESVGLVPTMGAIHAGHLALVAAAREACRRVVASLFVNPKQFGPAEDFAAYPRDEAGDAAAFARAGVALVFAPSVAEMYPAGFATSVRVGGVADVLEGARRPGHFDGVATVVAKLLLQALPDAAFFGEKDYQQLLVIRRLVEDLGLAVRIEAVPTVRGPDGLALSSRNRYLDRRQKAAASQLNRVLAGAAAELRMPGGAIEAIERAARDRLTATGMKVDYVAVRRAADLGEAKFGDRPLRVLAAVWCGDTRLIDNFAVD
jgi:pantoate--beta-alanine ligase